MSRLHYNGSNSFLFVNATKIYQFKAKDYKIKDHILCLGNISKDCTINKMKTSQISNCTINKMKTSQISKTEAINLMQNTDLTEKSRTL